MGILRRSFFPFNALGMPSFNNSVYRENVPYVIGISKVLFYINLLAYHSLIKSECEEEKNVGCCSQGYFLFLTSKIIHVRKTILKTLIHDRKCQITSICVPLDIVFSPKSSKEQKFVQRLYCTFVRRLVKSLQMHFSKRLLWDINIEDDPNLSFRQVWALTLHLMFF